MSVWDTCKLGRKLIIQIPMQFQLKLLIKAIIRKIIQKTRKIRFSFRSKFPLAAFKTSQPLLPKRNKLCVSRCVDANPRE